MSSVLVVDDEDQVRQLVREALGRAGYQVWEAQNGKEALQQYRQQHIDLVVMDIVMPEQDGLASIIAFRREFPKVKVIAITGSNDIIGILGLLDVAEMLGASRALQKPFEIQALLDTVAAELQV